MSLNPLDAFVTLASLALSAFLYKSRVGSSAGKKKQSVHSRPQGYLLHNQVTHARFVPKEAAHAFTYPTLAYLVSLDALEHHKLDLGGGWVFGYGGLWGRITGLRSTPYLTQESGSIRGKLEGLLIRNGFKAGKFQDAWMLTMPSFLGFEGINPLTIHNTFGESHVHILELGRNEDESPSTGYDHQWTFRRQFHVPLQRPFWLLHRLIKSPSHPPMLGNEIQLPSKPSVRVHQYTASESDPTKPGVLKLTALFAQPCYTPHRALPSARSGASTVRSPLTFPRILYVAWVLHYTKRLNVYLRPDPLPSTPDWDTRDSGEPKSAPASLGVKWLGEGNMERFARLRVEEFLARRSEETGVRVTLIAANPHAPKLVFLIVWYTSSKFFSVLFLCPSAAHALLLGCETEQIFRVSSKEVFLDIFSPSIILSQPTPQSLNNITKVHWLQRLRARHLPNALGLPIPPTHYLDQLDSGKAMISSAMVISASQLLDGVEKTVFGLASARVVEGQEPWKMWERAEARWRGSGVGSVVGNT
ncbi:hypothetical protein BJ912DRAFT_987372 [Pholiota molesta]|nr:hypothetical protein BJ912DRAFT_987372 [Pholiota molesta]